MTNWVKFDADESLAVNMFFFSSRRRHTRLQGDWSSDVCSSDLGAIERVREAVLVEMDQHVALLTPQDQVGEDHLGGGVVVPAVVRRELVGPHEREIGRASCRERG